MTEVTQTDSYGTYWFLCSTPIEVYRAKTLFTKEAGTVEWLNTLKADDTFYDIGANIGIYTILAATRLTTGHVYAFEPHIPNAASLLRNVIANSVEDRVTILTTALSDHTGFAKFNYVSEVAGSSGHQLGHVTAESGATFKPVLTELKYGLSVDSVVWEGSIPRPTVVKIDVDGNELSILKGMSSQFAHDCPRELQVEIHRHTKADIVAFLRLFNYVPVSRNDTANGKQAIIDGKDPASVAHNVVFRRS